MNKYTSHASLTFTFTSMLGTNGMLQYSAKCLKVNLLLCSRPRLVTARSDC